MSRRTALIAAGVVVLVAVIAVVVASTTNPSDIGATRDVSSLSDLPVIEKGPLPSLDLGQGWLNTSPLDEGDLHNKVVLYDFWTYSCVNCVRTLPYLEAWHERYAKDGLVLVGVHSPEFDFEKNHDNVRAAVKRLGVTYPVVLDDDMDIWNAFHNQYWPAKYITDRKGNVRYAHFGEGEYSDTENVIRLLLGVDKNAPRAQDPKRPQPSLTAAQTPETYLGVERGSIANSEELASGPHRYKLPADIGRNQVGLEGNWLGAEEYVESTDAHEALVLNYHGGEVNLVIDRSRKNPTYAVIELDGKPVPEKYRGEDVTEFDGETQVKIDAADMYNLIRNGPPGDHLLRIHPGGAGVQLFAFTFGQ